MTPRPPFSSVTSNPHDALDLAMQPDPPHRPAGKRRPRSTATRLRLRPARPGRLVSQRRPVRHRPTCGRSRHRPDDLRPWLLKTDLPFQIRNRLWLVSDRRRRGINHLRPVGRHRCPHSGRATRHRGPRAPGGEPTGRSVNPRWRGGRQRPGKLLLRTPASRGRRQRSADRPRSAAARPSRGHTPWPTGATAIPLVTPVHCRIDRPSRARRQLRGQTSQRQRDARSADRGTTSSSPNKSRTSRPVSLVRGRPSLDGRPIFGSPWATTVPTRPKALRSRSRFRRGPS